MNTPGHSGSMPGFALCADYERGIPELRRLISKSKRAQWQREDIDWTALVSGGDYERILEWHGALRSDYCRKLPPADKERLARQMVAFDFSQILHGEQAAMMLAGQLITAVEDLDAKLYAAMQAQDESRHVEVVLGLVRRLGPVYPESPRQRQLLETLIRSDAWTKQVLGLQLFVEARALLCFRQHLLFVADPVFQDATRRIEGDEARHVAFGLKYLRHGVRDLTAAERAEMVAFASWLNDNIWRMTAAAEYRACFEECDLDFAEFNATYRAPRTLAPEMSLASKKSLLMMYEEFGAWFQRSMRKIGLSELEGMSPDPR